MTKLRLITQNLLYDLKKLSAEADTIYWMTAFLMKSGVKEVLPDLREAAMRGADIKILTGDYLSFTQLDALQMLIDEIPTVEFRMMESGGTSFHPKAFLFQSKDCATVIVGSSNLSKSALTSDIEWNLYAPSSVNAEIFETAALEFMSLFLLPNTVQLNSEQINNYRKRYDETNQKLPFSAMLEPKMEIEFTFGATNLEQCERDTKKLWSYSQPVLARHTWLHSLKKPIQRSFL